MAKKYQIELQGEEGYVADSLRELATWIEDCDLAKETQDGTVALSGDHYTADIKVINH